MSRATKAVVVSSKKLDHPPAYIAVPEGMKPLYYEYNWLLSQIGHVLAPISNTMFTVSPLTLEWEADEHLKP